MKLRDRIGSAISCGDRDDAFATVVFDDAIATVEQEQVETNLSNYFPLLFPKTWAWIGVLGLIFAATILSPQWNFFSPNAEDLPLVALADRADIEASVDGVVSDLQQDEALRSALAEELAALEAAATLDVEPTELRREALRKMTDLQRKLDNLLNDENALAYKETVRRLQSLELPQDEETTKLAAALKSGNFSQAKQEVDALQKKLESEQLSEEERKQLAESLKKLGEQLAALENANEALSEAIAAAGMDPNLASDALAAANAIKGNKKLTEAQKKKLLEMLEAQKQAASACKKMGAACKKCASGKPADFAEMAAATEQLDAMKMFMTKAEFWDGVADSYAADGYLAVAPAVFDRQESGVELGYEGDDITAGRTLKDNASYEAAVLDLTAAVEAVSGHGKVGPVGYCWGGTLSFLCGTRIGGVSACVVYYGGQIIPFNDETLNCPSLMHFGERDAGIPLSDVDAIKAAHPDADVNVYAADHGFNCDHRGSYDAHNRDLARQRTDAFYAKNLA